MSQVYDAKYKTYLAPIKYLNSHFIYEYDIAKANLSVLYSKGIITEDEYNIVKTFSRDARQYYFGMLQKDANKSRALAEGLAEYRERFIKDNNITNDKLLSVKNDAIYAIDTNATVTNYDAVEFVKKNVYTSFYHINKLEYYYLLDSVNDREVLDIKGISDKKLIYHKDHFIIFLCTVFESIESGFIKDTLEIINEFYNKYLALELDTEYYREFNSDSCFRVSRRNGDQYLFETLARKDLKQINIMNNLNIIRELYSIVSMIHFNSK